MRVCFVSNGRGEDQAAAWIAARLVVTCPVAQVVAASLVTRGDAYRAKGIPVVVSGTMPW